MSKVLYIKANPKSNEESRTFRISEKFIEACRKESPDDEIITIDLYRMGCQFLTHEVVTMHQSRVAAEREHPILRHAYQFKEADKFVIAAPMWNLGIPAILKAYIDYVVVAGITFKYTAQGAVGLCQGKKAAFIVTRGGDYMGQMKDYEMGERYLRTVFGFLGIADFTTIAAEGLDIAGRDVEAILQKAFAQAEEQAKTFAGPARRGEPAKMPV